MGPAVADGVRATLRSLLDEDRVVPVVGAGVSAAAAGLPTWARMIEHACDHLLETGSARPDELESVRRFLEQESLVAAGSRVRELLGAPVGEFPAWLRKLFDEPESTDSRLLHAIFNLERPLIATTNYDRLLSDHHPYSPRVATWQEPSRMQAALRASHPHVVHLHGVYDDPESVVFGRTDYSTLVEEPAYRAVLQSLWLDRTLLFIGYSFAGLQDPDFMGLLEWASTAFAGSPYTHYALMQSGTFDADDVKRHLHEWRVQLVGYGSDFENLPEWLERLNPSRERSQAQRAERLKATLEGRDPRDEAAARNLVAGLTPPGANVDLRATIHELFETRKRSVERRRRDLVAFQQLIRSIADPDAISEQIDAWVETRHSDIEPSEEFVETVQRAGEAMFIVSDELVSALKRRGVDIHQRVLDGYCHELLEMMKGGYPAGKDRYQRENMARVLTSVRAVLAADPDELFSEPAAGVGLAPSEPSLLVVCGRHLELRPLRAPANVGSTLSMNPEPIDAEVVRLHGDSVIAAFNSELLIAWDPRRDAMPVAEYEISAEEAYGICSVAHRETPEGLRSAVATVSGFLHELLDFEPTRVWRPLERGFLSDVFLFDEGRVFALTQDDRIVELGGDDEVVHLLSRADLPGLLEGVPGFPPSPGAGFSIRAARPASLDGRDTIALETRLRSAPGPGGRVTTHGMLVFLEPGDAAISVAGVFLAGEMVLTSYDLTVTPDGSPLLLCGFLSDVEDTHDLVAWARGLPTREGIIFVHQGSTLRIDDDLISIVATDDRSGFAGDDSGGLYSFATDDGSFEEHARRQTMKARGLRLVAW